MGLSASRESLNAFPDFSEIPNFPKDDATQNPKVDPTNAANSKSNANQESIETTKTKNHLNDVDREFEKIYERSSEIFKSMTQNPCETLSQHLTQCLLQHQTDLANCHQTMDTYQECVSAQLTQKLDEAANMPKKKEWPTQSLGKSTPSPAEIMQNFTFMEATAAAAPPTSTSSQPSMDTKEFSEKIGDFGAASKQATATAVDATKNLQMPNGVYITGQEEGPAYVHIRDIGMAKEAPKELSSVADVLRKESENQARASF